MLGRHVPAVHAVKGGEDVTAAEQLWLPRLVARVVSARMHRLDAHDPWAECAKREPIKNARLSAFDIDRHEVNLGGVQVLVQDRVERTGLHRDRYRLKAAACGGLRLARVQGSEARARDRIERERAVGVARRALDDRVTRPEGSKVASEGWVGLNEQAAPAEVIQTRGDRQVARLVRTDIDLGEAIALLERRILLSMEGAPDADVFGILRVRHLRLHVAKSRRQRSPASRLRAASLRRQ